MKTATIHDEVDMQAWPPKTYLVELSDPMVKFDPETGEQIAYSWIAIQCKDSAPQGTFVFPSTSTGEFVEMTMQPMRSREFHQFPHTILASLGYTVV